MSNETLGVRHRLDLSSAELVEIQVLLDTYRDTLVQLIDDPATLLEELAVGYEKDRIKRLTKAQTILSKGSVYFGERDGAGNDS
jgi:uncharacterized membrane-anchored protein YhcB (DUF1043 family)